MDFFIFSVEPVKTRNTRTALMRSVHTHTPNLSQGTGYVLFKLRRFVLKTHLKMQFSSVRTRLSIPCCTLDDYDDGHSATTDNAVTTTSCTAGWKRKQQERSQQEEEQQQQQQQQPAECGGRTRNTRLRRDDVISRRASTFVRHAQSATTPRSRHFPETDSPGVGSARTTTNHRGSIYPLRGPVPPRPAPNRLVAGARCGRSIVDRRGKYCSVYVPSSPTRRHCTRLKGRCSPDLKSTAPN